MAHPLLMSALEDWGGVEEGVEGKGEETRAKGKEGGNKGGRGWRGGEGRQPVAHDHRITSSYSTSSAPVHGRSRVRRGSSSSSRSWKHISHLSFMCILMNEPWANWQLLGSWSRSTVSIFIPTLQDLFSRKGPSNSKTHFLSCKSHFWEFLLTHRRAFCFHREEVGPKFCFFLQQISPGYCFGASFGSCDCSSSVAGELSLLFCLHIIVWSL